MPGFIWGYGENGQTSGLKPPGMKEAMGPNMELELKLELEVTWPTVEILGPPYNWQNIKGELQVGYINYNKATNVKDKNFKVIKK